MSGWYGERVDAAHNRYRWYHVRLEHDLFAPVALVMSWGRLGRPGGQLRRQPMPDAATATRAWARKVRQKQRRGYRARADA